MKQHYENYTQEDLQVWNTLFERQYKNMTDKASSGYQKALKDMREVLNSEEIPNFKKIGHWFSQYTGWQIEVVPGLIEVDAFFKLLAEKKFPSSTWLRTMDKLDYLEEPDMFHDTFGHIPLLSNPTYSEFMQQFGKLGMEFVHDADKLRQLQRLYWYTIEFGLIKEENDLRIYGAGILSSFGETNIALNSQLKNHPPFDLEVILQTEFITSEMQEKYFVLESFEQLEACIEQVRKQWKVAVPI